MFKVDYFLDNYYIIDANNVYVVSSNSVIGRGLKQYYSKEKIDRASWERLYKIGKEDIDVISINDYEQYLNEIKIGIMQKEESIRKIREARNKRVNRAKSGNIKKEQLIGFEKVNKRENINIDHERLKTRIKYLAFAGVLVASGAKINGLLHNRSKDSGNDYTIEKNINSEDKDIVKKIDNSPINNRYEDDEPLTFYYDGYDVSEESAKNVMQYLDLCKKYGDMYGEDYRLLMGTLAQELNGEHKLELDTPAVGIAQMEKKEWLNTYIEVYNEETKEYEGKWLIGPNSEDTINDEEFKKRPKSDDIIAKYGIENTINIETVEGSIKARAMMDALYMGQAYKNGATKSIPESDFQAYSKARENKGPIVYKTLEYGDDWKNHLDITNNGDDDYYKKVYAYADIISDYCQDNSPYITRVYDGEETIIFAVNAVQNKTMAKNK